MRYTCRPLLNALVDVPPGYRAVPHYDHGHHTRRYYALARALEDEARGWFTDDKLDEIATRFEAAEAMGAARSQITVWPNPRIASSNRYSAAMPAARSSSDSTSWHRHAQGSGV